MFGAIAFTPDPCFEGGLDFVLHCPRCGCGFYIEDADYVALFVLEVLVDFGIFLVECVFYQFEGGVTGGSPFGFVLG